MGSRQAGRALRRSRYRENLCCREDYIVVYATGAMRLGRESPSLLLSERPTTRGDSVSDATMALKILYKGTCVCLSIYLSFLSWALYYCLNTSHQLSDNGIPVYGASLT